MERFQTTQRVLVVKTLNENIVRREQCENHEPFLTEMKLRASLLYPG